jgi:hypothetical protein
MEAKREKSANFERELDNALNDNDGSETTESRERDRERREDGSLAAK